MVRHVMSGARSIARQTLTTARVPVRHVMVPGDGGAIGDFSGDDFAEDDFLITPPSTAGDFSAPDFAAADFKSTP